MAVPYADGYPDFDVDIEMVLCVASCRQWICNQQENSGRLSSTAELAVAP
jgi:hypothetical protein